MKKIAYILLMLLLLAGCRPQESSTPPEISTRGDVENTDTVYKYLNSVRPLEREKFNEHTPFYVDLNEDGYMDAIYNNNNGNIIFILSTESGLEAVGTEEITITKITKVKIYDNFILMNHEKNYSKDAHIFYFIENRIVLLQGFTLEMKHPKGKDIGYGKLTLVDGCNEVNHTFELYEIDSNGNKVSNILRNKKYIFDQEKVCYNVTENGMNYDYIENPRPPVNEDNENENKSNTDVIELTSLKNGDQVGDFTINDINHDPNSSTSFKLEGNKWVKAKISYIADGYEGYYFSALEPILDKKLHFGSDSANVYVEYDTPQYAFMDYEQEVLDTFFTTAHLDYLHEGNEIEVYAHVKDPTFIARYNSEGGQSVEILDLQITNDGEIKTFEIPNIKGFTNEAINGTDIDYSKHKCVIIPMSNTVNQEKLASKTILFGGKSNYSVSCSIIGTIFDVAITYKDNMDDEGSTVNYESLTNTQLIINGPFNSDMSHVKIMGKIFINGFEYEEFELTLDSVRDISDYIVLKY